jgi:hypothetical protein
MKLKPKTINESNVKNIISILIYNFEEFNIKSS